jgi:hypothetical protein
MDFPRRIFIALGEPSDVSSLASDDLRRQEDRERLQRAIREREAADRKAEQLEADLADLRREADLADRRRQNEMFLGVVALFILLLFISIATWFWFSSKNSSPPPPPPQPPPER